MRDEGRKKRGRECRAPPFRNGSSERRGEKTQRGGEEGGGGGRGGRRVIPLLQVTLEKGVEVNCSSHRKKGKGKKLSTTTTL